MDPTILVTDLLLHLIWFMDLQSVANLSGTCAHFFHTIQAIASMSRPPIQVYVYRKLFTSDSKFRNLAYLDLMVRFVQSVHKTMVLPLDDPKKTPPAEIPAKRALCLEADAYIGVRLEQMYRHAYSKFSVKEILKKLGKEVVPRRPSRLIEPPPLKLDQYLLPKCASTIRAFGGAVREDNEVCLFGVFPPFPQYPVMSLPGARSDSEIIVERIAALLQEFPEAKLMADDDSDEEAEENNRNQSLRYLHTSF